MMYTNVPDMYVTNPMDFNVSLPDNTSRHHIVAIITFNTILIAHEEKYSLYNIYASAAESDSKYSSEHALNTLIVVLVSIVNK